MNLQLRQVLGSDSQAITEVILAAFGDEEGPEISQLVRDLAVDPSAQPLLSLVATVDDQVVGHVLFTNVRLEGAQREVSAAILAPLAVHPDYRNPGIGDGLISEGLRQLKAPGVELVFVLGHPGYYPKCGFVAAGERGFEAPYPIAPENADAWMVQKLQPGVIGQVSGKVMCAKMLDDPKYWV